ncbi:hypothetical protein [Streptomyces sp. NPDC060031]|uniref:hypothetical protein n=1 Tax=Streptomyces sp. NPDC060031 TaxID=3347043 RepID=UPI0036810E54
MACGRRTAAPGPLGPFGSGSVQGNGFGGGELAAPLLDGAVDRRRLLIGELLRVGKAHWRSSRNTRVCRAAASAMSRAADARRLSTAASQNCDPRRLM